MCNGNCTCVILSDEVTVGIAIIVKPLTRFVCVHALLSTYDNNQCLNYIDGRIISLMMTTLACKTARDTYTYARRLNYRLIDQLQTQKMKTRFIDSDALSAMISVCSS
jgi:hypothetical protein